MYSLCGGVGALSILLVMSCGVWTVPYDGGEQLQAYIFGCIWYSLILLQRVTALLNFPMTCQSALAVGIQYGCTDLWSETRPTDKNPLVKTEINRRPPGACIITRYFINHTLMRSSNESITKETGLPLNSQRQRTFTWYGNTIFVQFRYKQTKCTIVNCTTVLITTRISPWLEIPKLGTCLKLQ